MRTTWSKEYIEEFRSWHEKILIERNYPEAIKTELRNARERWMPPEEKL